MTNKNIFVACDVSSQKEILDLLELIHKDISGIKIGLQYITQRSPDEIRELLKFNKPIFYDGKFFDIKNTLVESIKSTKDASLSVAKVMSNTDLVSCDFGYFLANASLSANFVQEP